MRLVLSLRTWLNLAFLPVVVLPLALVALGTNWQHEMDMRTVEQRIQDDLRNVGTLRVQMLEGYLQAVIAAAGTTAAQWPALRSDGALRDVRTGVGLFERLRVVGPAGRILDSSDAVEAGPDLSAQSQGHPLGVRRDGYRTELLVDPGGRELLRLSLPVKGAAGTYLLADFDTARVQALFSNPQGVRVQRVSFLVDSDGRVIAHSDDRIARAHEQLRDYPPVREALRGKGGSMAYVQPGTGTERSAAYLPVSSLGWYMVLTQPGAGTMLVPPAVANRGTALILALGLALAIAATAFLSHRIATPARRLGEKIGGLTRHAIAKGQVGPLPAPESGIREYDTVIASAHRLIEALGRTVRELDARSGELCIANQQMELAVENLKRLDQMKADFLDTLSHDLRIPLTAVVGYAELLEDADPPLGSAERAHVSRILDATERMTRMVEELLDYARLEAGRIQLHHEPVDLEDFLGEELAMFEAMAGEKSIRLAVSVPAGLSPLTVDLGRLRQILNNLLSNALKYTLPGGSVTVAAKTAGDWLTIAVTDTGIGLSEQDKAHLFEKFYRSSRPEVQQLQGAGLGLAFVKGMVEAHGGHLEVESALGRGSTFRLAFPLDHETGNGDPSRAG